MIINLPFYISFVSISMMYLFLSFNLICVLIKWISFRQHRAGTLYKIQYDFSALWLDVYIIYIQCLLIWFGLNLPSCYLFQLVLFVLYHNFPQFLPCFGLIQYFFYHSILPSFQTYYFKLFICIFSCSFRIDIIHL